MRALISGALDIAAVFADSECLLLRLPSAEWVSVSTHSITHCFTEAQDTVEIDVETIEEAKAELLKASDCDLALQLTLILLAPPIHFDESVNDLLDDLETLLTDQSTRQFVLSRLSRAPLPDATEVETALELADQSGREWCVATLHWIQRRQAAIDLGNYLWGVVTAGVVEWEAASCRQSMVRQHMVLNSVAVLAGDDEFSTLQSRLREPAFDTGTLSAGSYHLIRDWVSLLHPAKGERAIARWMTEKLEHHMVTGGGIDRTARYLSDSSGRTAHLTSLMAGAVFRPVRTGSLLNVASAAAAGDNFCRDVLETTWAVRMCVLAYLPIYYVPWVIDSNNTGYSIIVEGNRPRNVERKHADALSVLDDVGQRLACRSRGGVH